MIFFASKHFRKFQKFITSENAYELRFEIETSSEIPIIWKHELLTLVRRQGANIILRNYCKNAVLCKGSIRLTELNHFKASKNNHGQRHATGIRILNGCVTGTRFYIVFTESKIFPIEWECSIRVKSTLFLSDFSMKPSSKTSKIFNHFFIYFQ